MTAVDKTLIENQLLRVESESLVQKKLMLPEQQQALLKSLKFAHISRNLWLKLLFFGLGIFVYSSFTGVLTTLLLQIVPNTYEIGLFLSGFCGVLFIELLAKNGYFRYGLDDAFILLTQIQLIFGVGFFTENVLLTSSSAFVISGLFFLRYVNSLSGLLSVVALASIFAVLIVKNHVLPMLSLPFVMFCVSILIYWLYVRFYNLKSSLLYRDRTYLIKCFSLLLLYFSVNYMVVRELSEALLNTIIKVGEDLSFAWIFYILTFVIPIAFIFLGVKSRDRIMLYIGVLTFAFSVFTIRFYYDFMPVEYLILFSGIFLLITAYFIMVRIRGSVNGITFNADNSDRNESLAIAQVIIANSAAISHQPAVSDSPMEFGAGDFSGGGAGQSF